MGKWAAWRRSVSSLFVFTRSLKQPLTTWEPDWLWHYKWSQVTASLLIAPTCPAHLWLRPLVYKTQLCKSDDGFVLVCFSNACLCMFTWTWLLLYFFFFFFTKSFSMLFPCLKFVVWGELCSIFHPLITIIPSVIYDSLLVSCNKSLLSYIQKWW